MTDEQIERLGNLVYAIELATARMEAAASSMLDAMHMAESAAHSMGAAASRQSEAAATMSMAARR